MVVANQNKNDYQMKPSLSHSGFHATKGIRTAAARVRIYSAGFDQGITLHGTGFWAIESHALNALQYYLATLVKAAEYTMNDLNPD